MPVEVPFERLIDELSQSSGIIGEVLSTIGDRAAAESSDGEWSPRQIVEHLTALQIVWSDLMHTAYESGALPIREAHWMQVINEQRLHQLSVTELLERFADDRLSLIAFLRSLSSTELQFPYLFQLKNGKSASRSIDGIAQRLMRHEQQHIRTLQKLVRSVR